MVNNGYNRINIGTPRMKAFLLQLCKIFIRHRIRHYRHIVTTGSHILLPCHQHDLFCGLSMTCVCAVIRNCARNV